MAILILLLFLLVWFQWYDSTHAVGVITII